MAHSKTLQRGALLAATTLLLATAASCVFDAPKGSSEGGAFFVFPADSEGVVRAAPNSKVDMVIIERSGYPIPRTPSQPSNITIEPGEILESHDSSTSAISFGTAESGSGRLSFTGETSDGPIEDSVKLEIVEPDTVGLGACAGATQISSGVRSGYRYLPGFPLRVDHWKTAYPDPDDIAGVPVYGYRVDDITASPVSVVTPRPETSDYASAHFETSADGGQITLTSNIRRNRDKVDWVFEAAQPDQITEFFIPDVSGNGRAKLRVGFRLDDGRESCSAGIRARARVESERICVLTGVEGEAFVRVDEFGEFWVQFLSVGRCRITFEVIDEALLPLLAAEVATTPEFEFEVERRDLASGSPGGGGDFD